MKNYRFGSQKNSFMHAASHHLSMLDTTIFLFFTNDSRLSLPSNS